MLGGAVSTSYATVIIDVTQSGNNVVANGSGTLHFAGVSSWEISPAWTAAWPGGSLFWVGIKPGLADVYNVTSGPSFGTGGINVADTASGDFFGFAMLMGGSIMVPKGYSGGTLSGSATWNNTTIAGLGMTAGSYTYTWGSGGTADSLTLNIEGAAPGGGAVATPEPGTVMLMGSGILGMLGFRRRELLAYLKR